MSEELIGMLGNLAKSLPKMAIMLPIHIIYTLPYRVICKLRADRLLLPVASLIRFGVDRSDPAKLEAWIRDKYKDSDDMKVNFNRKDEYRENLFDKEMLPGSHIPVPPNMERGFFHYGRLSNGFTKDNLFTAIHFNPSLWADAYKKTRGRALTLGFLLCTSMSIMLFTYLGGFISFNASVNEQWGDLGTASSFSFSTLVSSGLSSLIFMVICLLPLIFGRKLSNGEHDVLALNEVMLDIQNQMIEYNGFEASKEEVSLASTEGVKASINSHTIAKQLNNFWRVHQTGEPMIYMNRDDGTARARGSLHGYEAGTPIMITLSDLNQNMLVTGKIGSGKTTGIGLPVFDRILLSFIEKGYPLQGFGLDGKGTIYHNLIRILKKNGISTDRFIPVGVEEGQFGIPIFHGQSVEKCIDILASTTKGEADQFFVPSALSQIERVLRIAKAYHLTRLGVEYEIATGGCTVDSPEWVKRLCNNPEVLFKTIADLQKYFAENENARYALYDISLKSAIDGCMEDWKNMLKAEETASSVISTINVFLKDFTSNGAILERFGQGRMGPQYKDLSLCLNGYFFFSALADTEYGEAARKINIFARSRLYNLITLREIEFKRQGKNPQLEPVIVFIDEHHLMASSGTTGLSDASILNISRSMGLVFIAMTQSIDAYETVLGKLQTQNMVQQMLSRQFLATKSEADMKYLEATCGLGYELDVYLGGVAGSEGYREIANNGVMTVPNTKIQRLSKITPIGMPTTIQKSSPEDRNYHNHAALPGYFGCRFYFDSGVSYISMINSEETISDMKKPHKFVMGGAIGESSGPSVRAPNTEEQAQQMDRIKAKEADIEHRGRSEGIHKIPLFSNNDLITTGNFRSVASIPQFGVEHWCRTELEPLYI